MVSAKRWCVALMVVVLLAAGGAVAWLYFGYAPKKAPFRARQVMATQVPPVERLPAAVSAAEK